MRSTPLIDSFTPLYCGNETFDFHDPIWMSYIAGGFHRFINLVRKDTLSLFWSFYKTMTKDTDTQVI